MLSALVTVSSCGAKPCRAVVRWCHVSSPDTVLLCAAHGSAWMGLLMGLARGLSSPPACPGAQGCGSRHTTPGRYTVPRATSLKQKLLYTGRLLQINFLSRLPSSHRFHIHKMCQGKGRSRKVNQCRITYDRKLPLWGVHLGSMSCSDLMQRRWPI